MEKFCCFDSACSPAAGRRSTYSSGKGRSNQGPFKYGFSLIKGKASHPMEDFHVAKFVRVRGRELGLFAIFDGHSGDSVPAYLQRNLFNNILNEDVAVKWRALSRNSGLKLDHIISSRLSFQDVDDDFLTEPSRSIARAYEKTDRAILSHNPDLGRGGSTAVTAILDNGRKLWVANVGDSRAVLSRKGQAVQMTIDHEPNTERDSIEDRGGFVSNLPGDVARVDGQLAVSRAFGDKNLKSHLRSDPDIQCADVDQHTDFLVLASDGLWKVMSNQEAVEFVRRENDPLKAAKALVAEAIDRDSKDDISCVVVRLKA